MPFGQPYQENWETVAIALTKGLEIRSRFRIIDPTALTKAQNVEFPVAGGPQKRRGHSGFDVALNPAGVVPAAVTLPSLTPYTVKNSPTGWLIGGGNLVAGKLAPATKANTGLGAVALPNGDVGVWTGSEFVTKSDFASTALPPILRPMSRFRTLDSAVYTEVVHSVETAYGMTVTAYLAYTSASLGGRSLGVRVVLDGVVVYDQRDVGVLVGDIRVVPSIKDKGVGVFWCNGGQLLGLTVSDTGAVSPTKVVVAAIGHMRLDVEAVGVTHSSDFVVAYRATSGEAVACYVKATWDSSSGPDHMGIDTVLATALVGSGVNPGPVAVSVHADKGYVCLVGMEEGTATTKAKLRVQEFDSGLAAVNRVFALVDVVPAGVGTANERLAILPAVTATGNHGWERSPYGTNYHLDYGKLTCAYRFQLGATDKTIVDIWGSVLLERAAAFSRPKMFGSEFMTDGPIPIVYSWVAENDGSGSLPPTASTHVLGHELVARAARTGAKTSAVVMRHGLQGGRFVAPPGGVCSPGVSLEPTYLTVDVNLKPIGCHSRGTAAGSFHSRYALTGGNLVTGGLPVLKSLSVIPDTDRPSQGSVSDTVTTYPRARTALLQILQDFMPPTRHAIIGNAAYIAGEQVWHYDGTNLGEAGFHGAPDFTWSPSLTGSVVPTVDPYFMRVDLVWRDAYGEEQRSSSVARKFTTRQADDPELEINLPLSWRDPTIEVYATAPGGSTLHLIARVDLAASNYGAGSVYTLHEGDFLNLIGWDAYNDELVSRKVHPASQLGYIQPNSLPACEVIRSGATRLWMAGGELPPGQVSATNLYQPGYVPGWNDYHTQTVGSNPSAVIDLAFVQDNAYIFKSDETFSVIGEGPDNYGGGPAWITPRHLAFEGCAAYGTVAPTSAGIFFLSKSGLSLLDFSGGTRKVGDADPRFFINNQAGYPATAIVDTVVFQEKDQVRWYTSVGEAVVLDVRGMRFSTWTGLACRQALSTTAGVYLLRANGRLWREHYSTGDGGTYTDDGAPIEMVIRTAWLSPATMGGFSRIRRVGWFGEFRGDHQVRMRVFYNEKDIHESEFTLDWTLQSGYAGSTWGSDTWGFGVWGGSTASKIWRWARRLARQKCSVVAFELSDLGATTQSFAPVCLGLEIGKRGGLDRVRTK